MRILLIEDDYLSSKVIAFQLSNSGYTIVSAADGKEALRMINQSNFNLIICDMILPDISGVTVFQLMNDFHEKKVPTIFISNLENGERILKQNNVSYFSFLTKPLASNALIEQIRKLEQLN
jgi:DNA-binding response OmpR family regulator